MIHHKEGSWLTLPVSIVIAGILVASSIYFGFMTLASGASRSPVAAGAPKSPLAATKIAPITPQDHIRGSASAKAVIVEYSDLECPFCKSFHNTLKQALAEHGTDVAWVFRQFPLDIHPKARKEAEASECAAELGGNDAFWKYADAVFAVTPSNNGLDPAKLPEIAAQIGLDRSAFEQCLSSGKYATKIEASIKEGLAAGVRGTPSSVIITSKGQTPVAGGAVPLAQLDEAIKAALK